jgi:hypothetical protein
MSLPSVARPQRHHFISGLPRVFSRVETPAQRNRLVGFPWSAPKEAFHGEHAASLLLVEYALLAQAPRKVLPLFYQVIGAEPLEHKHERLHVDAPASDAAAHSPPPSTAVRTSAAAAHQRSAARPLRALHRAVRLERHQGQTRPPITMQAAPAAATA